MTVEELKELLEEYSGVDVKIVKAGSKYDTAFDIAYAGAYSQEQNFVQLEIQEPGERIKDKP